MSVHDDLYIVQRCTDNLCRAAVGSPGGVPDIPEQEIGGGLDLGRVHGDAGLPRESTVVLRVSAASPAALTAPHGTAPVVIRDDPYNGPLWMNTDGLDDEALGAQGRHAP